MKYTPNRPPAGGKRAIAGPIVPARPLYVVPADPGPCHLEAASRLYAAAVLLEYGARGRLSLELATLGALALMGGALEHLEAVA
jgi:hypothetical protein